VCDTPRLELFMQKFKAWGLDAYTDNPELAEEFSSANLCVISISDICFFL
jgi:hypothetical protein